MSTIQVRLDRQATTFSFEHDGVEYIREDHYQNVWCLHRTTNGDGKFIVLSLSLSLSFGIESKRARGVG